MPPHQFILILLAVVGLPTLLTFFSLLHAHPRGKVATESTSDAPRSGIRALFSFHTPSTLFPPSAIISLTDDNSTFFLARPADFGPSLSAHGLSGQLWIGSGFGDDNLGRGGAGTGAEGELGCSDVPGWDGDNQKHRWDSVPDQSTPSESGNEANSVEGTAGQSNSVAPLDVASASDEEPSEDDGTDDHLHHPLPTSPVSKPAEPGQSAQHQPAENGQQYTHADIQSLQESAEISGKVVLLSRGGCGFLEKVKWAQRRGGKALIVGDHTRGGALITMYARGDTSNVTIPSLFTSHTTAHLLSSLIPPEDLVDDNDQDGSGKGLNGGKVDLNRRANEDRPTFTPASAPKSTSVPSKTSHGRHVRSGAGHAASKQKQKQTWLKSLASSLGLTHEAHNAGKLEDSRRPPSSGRLDWFSEKWTDESPKEREASSKHKSKDEDKKNQGKKETATSKETWGTGSHPSSSDDFVIGVQDWRDPDLVVAKAAPSKTKSTTTVPSAQATPVASKGAGKSGESGEQKSGEAFKGGSITPGSGQYLKPGHKADINVPKAVAKEGSNQESVSSKGSASQKLTTSQFAVDGGDEHEGLWVTLTPTTMSSSPFFDTLLVLVVSPLVTLTVVYALLLLRSRIRRRRWRAPKSVVDRLPIRTYHTMSCASTTSSSRLPTPQNSSPTSPLLHSSPRSADTRPRPRSVTASGIGDAVSASLNRATAKASAGQQEKPPRTKKYKGRQIECVVCLEEYVDGQSQVMSLPCGHEFHAECM